MIQILIMAAVVWLVIGLAMMPEGHRTTKLWTIFAIAALIALLTYWGTHE